MKTHYRKGVFIVVYSNQKNEIFYLILKRKLHWIGWEFPKAGVEQKESLINCVKRELKEETNLKPLEIKKFNISGKYLYNKKIKDRPGIKGQTFEKVYAIKTKFNKNIKLSKEHSDFRWLKFKEAYKLLTWKNQKKVLKEVHKFLLKKEYKKVRINFTSTGKLLLAGKNDITNEKLIKNYTEKNELVFHTSKPGSSFVVIKSKNPTQKDIKEAALFCAKYSHDWRDNKSDVFVHYFKSKDIVKNKKMKTGTFGVKNFKEIKIKKEEIENASD